MEYIFTEARPEHLPALAEILNHYILNTTVTFHKESLQPDEMRDKVFFQQPHYRAFIIQQADEILGYCAVSQWKKQEAYRNTAEINIYLRHDVTGMGIGSIAIQYLETFARDNDIHNLIAGLCSENYPSKRLFEKNAYDHCATFKQVGNKFGRSLDVIYLQKILSN